MEGFKNQMIWPQHNLVLLGIAILITTDGENWGPQRLSVFLTITQKFRL